MNLYFNGYRNVFKQDETLSVEVAADPLDPIRPTYQTSSAPKLLTDVVQFGDGYEQVSESGIRPIQRKFKLVYGKKERHVVAALNRFFMGEADVPGSIYARRPSEYFYMTLPFPWDPVDAQPRKYIIESAPTTQPEQFNAWTVTVDVREWFGF